MAPRKKSEEPKLIPSAYISYNRINFEIEGKGFYFDRKEFEEALSKSKPSVPEVNTTRPIDNRVLVLQDTEQNVTKGGIIIPETAKERPMKGTVIKAGPGTYSTTGVLIPTSVKEGDRILFGKYGGTEVILDGTTYLIMRDSDIYGIL
jgi:chaperonin GroES